MTTEERKVQLGVAVDATGARAGFDQVKAGAKDMAQAVVQSGQQAAKGLDGVGGGGAAAAAKIERDTRSMIASVQRTSAAMEAAGKSKADYFEVLANQRGISADELKPYLDNLRKIEAAQQAASGSLNKMGVSAAQTAAAMRGVPAQFTDIITSLQGGQAPMTVLLQQGGQLKDMFGGVGNAARALGGYMLSLATPINIAAAAVGVLGYAYLQGGKESKAYADALILTGNAAGTTVVGLQRMAAAVSASSGATTGAAAQALTALAGSSNIASASFEKFAAVALRVQRETGVAVEDTIKQFSELGKDPLEASLKLNEATHNLTLSVYEQIKALEEQGKTADAGALAQNNAADVSTQRMKDLEANLGLVEKAWRSVADGAKHGWDAILGIGRAGDTSDNIKQEIAALEQRAAPGRGIFSGLSDSDQKRLAALKEQLAYADHIAASNRDLAKFQAEQIDLASDKIKWDKEGLQYASEEYKLKMAIAKATEENNRLLAAGAITPKQAQDRLADIAAKSPLAKTALDQRIAYYEQLDTINQAGEKRALDTLTSLHAAQLLSDSDFIAEKQRLALSANAASAATIANEIAAVKASGIADKDKIEATTKYNAELAKLKEQEKDIRAGYANEIRAAEDKANREYIKSYADTVEAQQKKAAGMEDLVKKERMHVDSIGRTKEAIAELEVAELQKQATALDGMAITADQVDWSKQLGDAYREQAKAARELAELKHQGGIKEAADEARKEGKKIADSLNKNITDALMRGFESGKGFAENLRDTVENMFKTLVLRPVVELGVRGALSMFGIGGLSGAASAADTLGGASGVASGADALGGVSVLGSLKGWLTDFGGGVASQVSKLGNYLNGFSNATVSGWGEGLMNNATAIGDYAQIAGNALGYFNAALAASQGKWGQAIGAGAGTFFFGPLGGAIGSALGAYVDKAFGGGSEYTVGTGISGRFAGSSFDGRNYQDWHNDGGSVKAFGFFGPSIRTSNDSSGTNYSAMDARQVKAMGAAYGSILDQTAGFATALGASSDAILGYQKDIKLALGSDAEANKKAIAEMFKGLANEVAGTVLDSQYMREGEGAADTLARLATNLTAVNGALGTLGDTLLTVGQNSGDIASSLVDTFGGLSQYQSAIGAYYQRYYSTDERMAKTREQLQSQLGAAGLSVPGTMQDYRDLVNAQDLATDAGRKTYTMLIGLSSAFADVSQSAEDATKQLIKSARYGSYSDYAAASAAAGITATPRFAGGGDHYGGVRMVGENGPEIEATGAARIWNKSQMAGAMMAGSTELSARIDALREDGRAQARAMATLQARMVKLLEVWDTKGMPEVRTV